MGKYIFPFLLFTILVCAPTEGRAGTRPQQGLNKLLRQSYAPDNDLRRLYGDKWLERSETALQETLRAHTAPRVEPDAIEKKTQSNKPDNLTSKTKTEDESLATEQTVITTDEQSSGLALDLAQTQDIPPLYDIPVVVNKEVERFITYFQTKGRPYFKKWLYRSGRYMPMVTGILKENGLPEDLAYMALIESGFSPKAVSRSNAVGIWQFMLWTGRYNGLRTDWWIDERKDPEKATRAAAKHLTKLYSRFDSWYLTLAAYNAGGGKIGRAIKRCKSDDFWVIAKRRRVLKRETKNYIPKYLAAMIIAKDPKSYGFEEDKKSAPVLYDKVDVKGPTDIKVIAKAANTNVATIKKLNPELRRWFTPPNYPNYEIKIPKGSSAAYVDYMVSLPVRERIRFHTHRIRKGDTLSTIARRYGTSVRPIMYLNNLKSASYIRAGKSLVIPVRGSRKTRRRHRTTLASIPAKGTYIVRRGDTLWDISIRFNVPLERVLRWNKIKRTDTLRPGQRLQLKEASSKHLKEAVIKQAPSRGPINTVNKG